MYLLISALKWASILFLRIRLQREIRMNARVGRNSRRGKDSD